MTPRDTHHEWTTGRVPPSIPDPFERSNFMLLDHRSDNKPLTPEHVQSLWRPVRAADLRLVGQEPGTCDRCGRHDLRFLHTIVHLDGGQLQVGSECARRLCSDYSPKLEEAKMRSLWDRRARWLTRKWRLSKKGNEYITFVHERMKVHVTIFSYAYRPWLWSYLVVVGREEHFSPEKFASSDVAKLAAFDWIALKIGWSGAQST